MTISYAMLARALLPEAALVLGALLVLAYDLTIGRRHPGRDRLTASLLIGAAAVVAAIIDTLLIGTPGPVFGGALDLDPLAQATRVGVLGLALLTLGVTAGARPLRHPAEYVALLLLAVSGLTVMAAASQLLVAFVALELASLSLYVLAGFAKDDPDSAEAALKYFLFGGMAAAFLLFGFSLIYGLTGEIGFADIAGALARQGLSPLLTVALVMVLVGFGFKAAAAPFHLWAPDAYQGAPTPSAALIASASKLAGFTLFLRLLWPGLGNVAGDIAHAVPVVGWLPAVALMAAASLLLGNLAALAQASLRRLLAYSAIAHAGALLLGLAAVEVAGPGPLFYYAATYGLATVGAFGVVAVLERHGGGSQLSNLAGLSRRSPLLAGCLMVYVLSLAGVPPLAGFFGKFAVFAAALKLGGLAGAAGWVTLLAILLSAVAFYYYLLILKQALVAPPASEAGKIPVAPATALTLLVAAGLIVAAGLFPNLILDLF
ncbi:MAG: NADH-quinone oxidoreductase subunit N [Opitutaceae bacterium]|nr:NADH-quinone oxidoreductase subunit N [Opitutaceae bacterium]